jgi:ribosomal protein S6--L-glutamate ligase
MTDLGDYMIVGNAEWCALPELRVPAIRARIDSGAKTSSIHAINIHEFYKGNERWVSYEIHPLRIHTEIYVHCESPVVDYRMVKSSTGIAQPRYVIRTMIEMGGKRWPIEMTLANRRTMGYQMLLGREAMLDKVLINPAEGFRLTRYTKKQIRNFYGIEHWIAKKRKRK